MREILVLEGEERMARTTAKLLEGMGWVPVIAQSIEEGRQLLRTRPSLSAALLDVRVGQGDGVSFYRELPRQMQQRAVFSTSDPVSADRAWSTGQPVLCKPYTTDELQARLAWMSCVAARDRAEGPSPQL